ncbi:lipopolysaccharide assembly protein LapB [Cetobacterium sp. ZOR0034]|uniref:tetratricopeptide repeat protein n=1 Tax=Cetobacterium sp. ZOR0034 TaxID=1339239 RepID=UPI000646867D|nr:tetratricopeptide repeat protein [Cetobacterium sp. ZOR0034]
MKKIFCLIFILLSLGSFAEERPAQIQNLEAQIAREDDRDKAAVLIKEYERYFKSYLSSISSNENSIFYLGDQYFRNRKYERAAQIFSSNIDSSRNLFGAATSYRFIGDYNKAIDFYSVAITIEPSMKEAYLGRGLAYRNLGRYNKAIEDIQIYMNYSPTVEGFLALGDIYLAEKKIDRAREILQEGRRVYPQSKEISNMLTSTYSR